MSSKTNIRTFVGEIPASKTNIRTSVGEIPAKMLDYKYASRETSFLL